MSYWIELTSVLPVEKVSVNLARVAKFQTRRAASDGSVIGTEISFDGLCTAIVVKETYEDISASLSKLVERSLK